MEWNKNSVLNRLESMKNETQKAKSEIDLRLLFEAAPQIEAAPLLFNPSVLVRPYSRLRPYSKGAPIRGFTVYLNPKELHDL